MAPDHRRAALTVHIFQIDLDAADAALQLLAIMVWPNDLKAQANFLVKAVASSMAIVPDRAHQLAARELERHWQTVLPTLPDEARLPYAEAQAEKVARQVNEISARIIAEIHRDHFLPHGGFGREVYAPGLDAILREAEATAGGKYGRACGEILCYIEMMRRHHSDLSPSIRLARHIMEESAKHEGQSIPADRGRREMWKGWGGVAPLWAARALAASQSAQRRVPVQLVVQYAHWLANRAVGFRPDRSGKRLLAEGAIVRVNPKLAPLEPPIPPLTDRQLDWARSY